jgi:ABC-type transporter Mla MlaB component
LIVVPRASFVRLIRKRRRRRNQAREEAVTFIQRTLVFPPGLKVIVSTGRLELHGDLDVDARTAFIAAATEAIASADTGGTKAELDCSAVASDGPVDAATIGMLVTLARTAQRRGARIVLVRAPKTLRAQLESVDAAHFFNYRG